MKIPAIVYGAVLGLCAGQATASVLVLPPLQAFASTAAGTATGIESASSVFHQGGENADTQIAFAGSLGPTATISETNACCGVGTNPIANAVYQYAVVLNPGFHVKVGLVPIKWAADLDTRVLETAHFEGGGGKATVNIGMNSPITVDIEEDCSPGEPCIDISKSFGGAGAVVPGQAYAVHVGVFGGVTGGIAQVGAVQLFKSQTSLFPAQI